MSITPILFHDIDGVLFGEYAGEFQLRPGVKSWLAWAHEHFQVIWLTSWESEKIKTLLHILYCERFHGLPEIPPFHHANWMNYETKVVWLEQAVEKLKDREWFWIDDEIEKWTSAIQQAGLSLDRCIQSNPEGRDELLVLQSTLAARLEWIQTSRSGVAGNEEAA
ncbi:MAG: hypothetical protein A4C66_14775 [Nitrospira sp. HN-bin3]|uniref:HAD domain-containing protein n=1 Tax=Nitrospira cf. moscoviensis SBR1015 TaxID=96242 RepID=UPI000A0A69BB|nr:HAD domain-containing protein [Nitrospira cf. moscoviensis SBR1015]OQW47493.1 MAG: hypothetical protein A4C66_14775 [Nitrospira sp. HN-bin3]